MIQFVFGIICLIATLAFARAVSLVFILLTSGAVALFSMRKNRGLPLSLLRLFQQLVVDSLRPCLCEPLLSDSLCSPIIERYTESRVEVVNERPAFFSR
jgi:hypothetical protein